MPSARLAFEDHAVAGRAHRRRREAGHERHPAGVDEISHARAELAPRRQPIGQAAAKDPAGVRAAHHPDDAGPRPALGELHEIEQHVRGRVAGADHTGRTSLIGRAVAPEHVGQPVGDPAGVLGFALCRQAAGAERVRHGPGAGRVDDGACEVTPERAAAVRDRERRTALSPRPFPDTLSRPCRVIASTVAAGFDDGRHFRGCGEGLQIGVVEIAAGRKGVRRRLLPAVPHEKRARGTVGVVSPRREQPHMAPLAHARRDRRTRLVDPHRNAALDEMRGDRKADRSGADDGNGKIADVGRHDGFLSVRRRPQVVSAGDARRPRSGVRGPRVCRSPPAFEHLAIAATIVPETSKLESNKKIRPPPCPIR